MKMDRDGRGPEHPVAGAMMLDGSDQADGNNGNAELLRDAEAALFEHIDVAIARALGFRKNDEARAAVDGVLREAPHALEIGRTADVGDRDVAEALHQPAIRRNLEVRFQFPAANVLRNGAVEYERVEKIDVIHHEEAGALRIERGRANDLQARAGEKDDAAAEAALKPVVLMRVQKNAKENEQRRAHKKMHAAQEPQKRAAQRQQSSPHI